MSTPEPHTRDAGPADPSRPWVQQTLPADDAASAPATQSPRQPTTPQQDQDQNKTQPPPAGQPRQRQPTLGEAAKTIKPSDFLTFHQAPCARPGLLTGIGAGAAVGAVRWIMGLPVPRAANWAVGAGVVAALGQYEYCQFQRRQEREKVRRVVEVYAAKQAREKREKEEEERRAREKREREEEEERSRRSRWRFW